MIKVKDIFHLLFDLFTFFKYNVHVSFYYNMVVFNMRNIFNWKRNFNVMILALAAVLWAAPAFSCTDILNAFLSVEKLNENLKNELITINETFQRLDVALSQKNLKNGKTEIGKLIDYYFDFYMKYYQNPPAQFVGDPRWHDKLSLVNQSLKTILEFINKDMPDEAHSYVKIAYESFSAIYKDRVPMQEQNIMDMIVSKLDTIETEMKRYMVEGGTNEIAIHANNLNALSERLLSFENSSEAYLKQRADFTAILVDRAKYLVKTPINDTVSCSLQMKEISALKGSLEIFLDKRKAFLNKDWFEQKK